MEGFARSVTTQFMSAPPTASSPDYLELGFQQIEREIRWLADGLAEVLAGLGEPDLARQIPWRTNVEAAPEPAAIACPPRQGLALAMAFQLLNTVEEHVAETVRSLREEAEGLASERGLWADQIHALQQSGASSEEILEAMRGAVVELVFTAHPTEAKRTAVLELHRELMQLLQRIGQGAGRERLRSELIPLLERLWRTGEILLQKPSVADERRNVLNYLRDVLPPVIPELDRRLDLAWQRAGFPLAELAQPGSRPALRFGTWVGGDRDGHPGVTAVVTAETLERLRANALVMLHRQLTKLAARLPAGKQTRIKIFFVRHETLL